MGIMSEPLECGGRSAGICKAKSGANFESKIRRLTLITRVLLKLGEKEQDGQLAIALNIWAYQ